MGEGEACMGVSTRTGGRENSFWRDTFPKRKDGKFNSGVPGFPNVVPSFR